MAKGSIASASAEQPTAIQTPALKKSSSNIQSVKNQKTLFGFFQKTPTTASSASTLPETLPTISRKNSALQANRFARTSSSTITPAPSSDAFDEDGNIEEDSLKESSRSKQGLPSPVSSTNGGLVAQTVPDAEELTASGTPSRKVSWSRLQLLADMLTRHRQRRT
jgi:hypothetical protein